MATTAVNITLRNIHCSDEGDGPGSAEPYLWTVFFKIDGDTASVQDGALQGTATVVGTSGNHGDLGPFGSDVDPGEDVPIPPSLGQFSSFVRPIPAGGGVELPGVIGYIAILAEQDRTPDHAIASGHVTLNQAVQDELNALIPTLRFADLANLDPILEGVRQRVEGRVRSAIRNSLSTGEAISSFLNRDDTIGTDIRVIFAQNEQIGTDPFGLSGSPIALERRFQNQGDWTLSGQVTVTLSRHVFLRIIGRPGPGPAGPIVVGSGPLPGVSVRLFELDRPAPAGDDVVVPQTGETEQIVNGREIVTTTTYDPSPDQLLGVQTTDASGVAPFQIFPNRRGGVLTRTRVEEDLHSHQTETTMTHTTILEERPDYGVTVFGTGGKVLATRQLVALNAAGDVGTAASPIDVLVDRDEPVIVAS